MAKTSSKNNAGKSIREFAMIGFLLLAVLFGMQIMAFIFGNIGTIDNFPTKNVTSVINETVDLANLNGVGTIVENTNPNFLTYNASLVINITGGVGGPTNATLIEGTDYVIFPLNGSVGNITFWNSSLVTYDITRKSDGQITSESINNDSLNAISNYSTQAGTQFTTLGIAITLVVLVAVFLFFWLAFMGGRPGGKNDAGSFG